MTVNQFMDQINRDIEFRQEGKIPILNFTGRMLRKLQRNGFVVTTKLPYEPEDERAVTLEELENKFMHYRPKEVVEAEKLKNQKRMDEYG